MRKYIIGTLFGLFLATTAGANAQEVTKLIDSVVQGVFPVTVEGNSVGEAIVVNDKTYLPVREFGEAVGYKVTFTEDREVVLTKNGQTTTNPDPVTNIPGGSVITPSNPTLSIDELKKRIQEEKDSILSNKQLVQVQENSLKDPNIPKADVQKFIDMYNKAIADAEKRIADYEAQITALQAK